MILPLIQPPAHDHRPVIIRALRGQVPAMACGVPALPADDEARTVVTARALAITARDSAIKLTMHDHDGQSLPERTAHNGYSSFGEVFVKAGFFPKADDIFLLRLDEVPVALFDMYHAWSVGVQPRGGMYWAPEIARRRGILGVLRGWNAPPALGRPPEVVTEPFTIMLWGITSDSVASWLRSSEEPAEGALSGFGASPGSVEGPARVILAADQIGEVQPGEILVAPLTAPSWAPIFSKILATVTDVGGMMSHTAIVCREYGLPAVTGTAFGTTQIRTGQRIRVDGTNGTVDDAGAVNRPHWRNHW